MAKKKSKTQKAKISKAKVKKPKTAVFTWKAKKKPTGKKATKNEPHYEYKFRLLCDDGEYYSDLHCTQPASSPETLEHEGWERFEDDPVNNPDYPNVRRRIQLRKADTSGDEPVVGFMG